MKGFFATLFIVCGLLAAAWFAYDPYLRPLVERFTGAAPMTDDNPVITGSTTSPQTKPAQPKPTNTASTTATPKPTNTPPSTAPSPKPAPQPLSELDAALELKYPMPEIIPLLTIVDQWRNVPANAYPPEVTATETIPFQLVINGQAVGSSNVAPGTPLKPMRLTGDQLTVASLANPAMNTQIPVAKTDFKQRIEARYNQFVAAKTKEVEAKRARARQIVSADPSKLAALTGKGAAPAAPAGDSGDPRFAPVKSSLSAGEAASVTLEEATSFVWNGSERVGGEFAGSYDTVTVHFSVATIFGRFPVEYKALLRGGKVHAWIDPVTDERL
jgi:hypothetical protein